MKVVIVLVDSLAAANLRWFATSTISVFETDVELSDKFRKITQPVVRD